MNHKLILAAWCAASSIVTATGMAADNTHVIVPGYERFRQEHLSAAQAGDLLISELNCRSCHEISGNSAIRQRQAPVLTNVASRVTVDYLRKAIADPQSVKPGTAMPQLLHGAENAEDVEALVHFLASSGAVVPSPVSSDSVKRGENLFHSVGCAACHGDQRIDQKDRPAFLMPLGAIDTKYTVASLSAFLSNPHAARPSGRMPSLNLSAEEARDITNYLLQDIDVAPNINVAVYHESWNELPDFSSLKPVAEHGVSSFDVRIAGRKDGFGLRFTGYLHAAKEGEYRFFLGSDDGSRMLIDGKEVVNVDGVHPHTVREGRIKLASGAHEVVIEYFEAGGEESLTAEVQGPGFGRQPLAGLMSLTDQPPTERRSFQPESELVAQGQKLFASLGCASCHQHGEGDSQIASLLQAPGLTAGNSNGGCLSPTTDKKAPYFVLSDRQRQDVSVALKQRHADNEATDEELISNVMLTLNCYACHQRNRIGGAARELEALFTGTIPEMGDEGRIPPHLDGVGDKLNSDWLTHVMNEGAKDRPYMLTRMPKFGKANVGALVERLVANDLRTEVDEVEFIDAAHRVSADARLMVGDQALSCIKCHTFDKHKATGIQSLDMTTMTRRLRRDWFHRYLLNPQAFRPGTRMPAAWPNGRSVVPHILHGDPAQQIESIWQYLSAGKNAKVPSGLVVNAIELKPTDRPIIYRNFIEGLSPRGIAVGFPEKAHIAWDAEEMNLRLIWHGAFIDASKHWVGRGPGNQVPLGDHLMTLPAGAPLAVLSDLDASWPSGRAREQGFKFKGYSLNEDRQPTFRYEWNGVQVTDSIVPVPSDEFASLQRTITLQSSEPVAGLYLRITRDSRIENDGNQFVAGDAIQFVAQQSSPIIRDNDGQQELLVPISFDKSGRAVVSYAIVW